MNAFEALEWMLENRTCICGGTLEKISENELRCDRCELTIRIMKSD